MNLSPSKAASVEPPEAVPACLDASRLTDAQREVLDAIREWRGDASGRSRQLTFGGYAGVGKTTLLRVLLEDPQWRNSAVLSFTGKAVDVLHRKGMDQARTIHSFLYFPRIVNGKVTYVKKEPEAYQSCRAIVVDEAQAINRELYRDLCALDIPMLLVGDMGQLEPIGDDPKLMRKPDLQLTEVHRQAENSAIIRFSQHVREDDPGPFAGSDEVQFGRYNDLLEMMAADQLDQVICGYNRERVDLNTKARGYRGFSGPPEAGDRVICLLNNKLHSVFNGMMATVKKCKQLAGVYTLDLLGDDGVERTVPAAARQFMKEKPPTPEEARTSTSMTYWDFGYAVTVYKAMGSEWDRVGVFQQLYRDTDPKRWKYTAATRAAKYLFYTK